jgi:macrolide-specific efflux system membrane fusion protein
VHERTAPLTFSGMRDRVAPNQTRLNEIANGIGAPLPTNKKGPIVNLSALLKFCATAVALAFLAGCALLPATRTEQVAAEPTPTPIPTAQIALKPVYQVQRGEVVKTTEFSGRISPVVEEDLFFRRDGRVRTVFAKRNELVKKGDIIADQEIDGLERELRAAEIELERATVTLAEAERNHELDREVAQTLLEMEQIRLDGMEQDRESTRAAIALQAKAVEMAQIAVDRLSSGVNPLLKTDLQRAQYSVEKLKQEIAEAQIIAPFDGKLLSVSLTPGQAVTGYQVVATIADPNTLEVSADLLSEQLKTLTEQMSVTLSLSNRPGTVLHGQIRRLPYPYGSGGGGQTIEEKDKSTRISIEESSADAGYQLGDLVRVIAEVERKDDVVWVPPQAIRNFNGRRFAVVQDGDVQRRVDVKIGIQAEDRVEIEEGLEDGQTVVAP